MRSGNYPSHDTLEEEQAMFHPQPARSELFKKAALNKIYRLELIKPIYNPSLIRQHRSLRGFRKQFFPRLGSQTPLTRLLPLVYSACMM
ncbi:hypothetical protein J6590_086360 [Homalodisca vitripennis]|nr:hypothetical protein J6590_086360 [Homalodisca vitripennis]